MLRRRIDSMKVSGVSRCKKMSFATWSTTSGGASVESTQKSLFHALCWAFDMSKEIFWSRRQCLLRHLVFSATCLHSKRPRPDVPIGVAVTIDLDDVVSGAGAATALGEPVVDDARMGEYAL